MDRRLTAPFARSLAALTVATLGLASVAAADEKRTPFVASVLGHFDRWDADHDGKLSRAEIDALLKDPGVTGDDAAAVSALKLVTRGSKTPLPPLTVEYFEQYNATAAGASKKDAGSGNAVDATTAAEGGSRDAAGGKPVESPLKWDRYFTAGKKRLADAGGEQWRTSSFDIKQMQQGALGDCFFVASLGSVVSHRPEQIGNLIAEQPDGSYKASFPGVPAFGVPKLTQSQIAISGTSGAGAFLAVFEQAFGKYRSQLKGGAADVDGTDVLFRGGDSAPTLQQLTGHDTRRISFGKNLEARAAAMGTVLPEVRKLLTYNIEHHLAITGGGVIGVPGKVAATNPAAVKTKGGGTLPVVPPDILQNHVYVVVDFDPKTDLLTMWNPHGQAFTPKGEPGLKNGYAADHGRFMLPLAEAYQFYGSFTFETENPAKPPTAKTAEMPAT